MNSAPVTWKIALTPAKLTSEEFLQRYDHFNMPEKFEAIDGKLFWNEEQRLHVLGMLFEAVGLKRALSLCPAEAVRQALSNNPL